MSEKTETPEVKTDQTQTSQTVTTPNVETTEKSEDLTLAEQASSELQKDSTDLSEDSLLSEGLKVDEVEALEYELSLEEDSILGEDDLTNIIKYAEEAGLTEEQAKSLIKNTELSNAQGFNRYKAEVAASRKAAVEETKADPLFNTKEAMQESFGVIKRVTDKFQSEELAKFLKSDAGNNLGLLKMLHTIGLEMGSDTIEGKGADTGAAKIEKSALERQYPDFYQQA